MDLSDGNGVQPHALFSRDTAYRLEGAGLRGIEHGGVLPEMLPESGKIHAAVVPYPFFIHQVKRRAERVGQLVGGMSGETQCSVGVPGDIVRDHAITSAPWKIPFIVSSAA